MCNAAWSLQGELSSNYVTPTAAVYNVAEFN